MPSKSVSLKVAQRDWTPDVDHVVLTRVRLHDVAHALLADDLGDDVVAQRARRVPRVGQAAASKAASARRSKSADCPPR